MFEINKLQQVKIGLAISIGILFIIAFIVFTVNRKNNDSVRDAMRCAESMVKIEEVYSTINELESAHRGYFITQNPHFLVPYKMLKLRLINKVTELREISDSHIQFVNALELENLVRERLILMETNMDVKSTSKFLVGNVAMTKVLLKIGVMKEIEETLMKKKVDDAVHWSNRSTVSVVSSVSVAIVLIIIASLALIREYSRKLKIETQLLLYQNQLNEKIEKLNESNKELDQFAYIASHDLQEPLRKITTFNERITEKYSDDMPSGLKDYLDRISNAANRMRALIDDLLTYSRTAKSGMKKVSVNLERVFNIIKDNCEVIIQNRNVRFIHHNRLPVVYADATQMVQLFQNLVINAIKFTNPDITPTIEIFSSVVSKNELKQENMNPGYDEYYKINVKDNGIGFNEKDIEKIFVIFQRLNGRSEYEGTGIGLSICKKIIENHEGYIKAESQKGKGSIFTVLLPKIDNTY